MTEGIVQLLTVPVDGRTWNLYAVDYDTADGQFSVYIHAISFEHAAAMVAELRETARLSGQVEGIVEGTLE